MDPSQQGAYVISRRDASNCPLTFSPNTCTCPGFFHHRVASDSHFEHWSSFHLHLEAMKGAQQLTCRHHIILYCQAEEQLQKQELEGLDLREETSKLLLNSSTQLIYFVPFQSPAGFSSCLIYMQIFPPPSFLNISDTRSQGALPPLHSSLSVLPI